MPNTEEALTTSYKTSYSDMGIILEESLNEIFVFDALTLKFLQVNKGARENTGYSMQELLSMTPVDLKPDHTTDSFLDVIAPVINGEQLKIEFDSIHQRKDGSTYNVEVHLQKMDLNDRPVFVAIIVDTTERVRMRSELELAHAYLESAPDPMVIVGKDGQIKVANRQMSKLFGYTQNELLRLNIDMLVPPRFRASHAERRASYDANPRVRGMGAGLDLAAITKDGREIPIEVSLSPIKTDNGRLVAAAIRDISERKETEQALKESEAKLRVAKEIAEQATATKTRFLAAASHDLRQPLQALRLYLSALGTKIDDPKAKQLSDKMHLSLDTMGELLESLLDISSLESGSIKTEKRNFNLNDLLDRLVAANALQAIEKGLELQCDTSNYVVNTDLTLLERIIENFLTNAIRYTDNGKIIISCQAHDGIVTISVEDTGLGIPKEDLENVFDEYYQLGNSVRDRRQGLGLGLSIVKHISRILNHKVYAKSTHGEGSVFSVEVPLGDDAMLDNSHEPRVNIHKVTALKPSILIIDDDPTIIDAMAELMETFDVRVTTANNGLEALEYITKGLHPDMLLTDYRMPTMSGLELIREVRKLMRIEIPAVIMTGDTSAQKITDAKLPNCTVLHKPIDMTQLVSLIESIKD